MPDECTHAWHRDRCTRCDAVKPFASPLSHWWLSALCLIALVPCLPSCTGPARILSTHDVPSQRLNVSTPQPLSSCVAIDADLLDEPGPFEALSLWGHRSKFWPNGTTLRVRFLEGSASQQAQAWRRFQAIDKLAGIQFVRVDAGPSDLRVSFRPGSGHWSYLGTDCRLIPQGAATMNLGLSRWESDREWDRVALHECLHALGFGHELQHPHARIPWNVPVVLADYARTQGWSEAQTRRQVLTRDDGADFVGSMFDKNSIMCYRTDRRHVTDPAYVVGDNDKVTCTDERIIREVYP